MAYSELAIRVDWLNSIVLVFLGRLKALKSLFAPTVILLVWGTSGCSSSPEATGADSTHSTPTLSSKPAEQKKIKPLAPKVVKTPEAECDEVVDKLKEAKFWSSSGMTENGKQRMIQDVYVADNGVLQMGMCDWFWELSTTQIREWLEQIQQIWASVHSPDKPCKAKLSCWVPDMKNKEGIPIKVDCKGVSEARAQKLLDETRGKVSAKTLERYRNEQFAELRNRPSW